MTYRSFALPLIGGLIMTMSAMAGERLNVNIPFAFHTGKATMPAGKYRINVGEPAVNVITLHSGKGSAMINSSHVDRVSGADCKLVFHRYGDTFYLSEVWSADGAVRKAMKTSAEREAEMAAARAERVEVAVNTNK